MIIGITGGSGSGKTTLLEFLREKGAVVLDCDRIYHRLLETDPALLVSLENRFPKAFLNGKLQRKLLGKLVFADENALKDLNRITHSRVKEEITRLLADKPDLAVIDAIGLFEGELNSLCDITVAVCAPVQVRISRLTARDGITPEYATARIRAQKEDDWYTQRCDHVLHNDSTPEVFQQKCIAFWEKLSIIKQNQ